MKDFIHQKYAEIEFLREKARKRIPQFAFEYLDSGCNSEVNLRRNTSDIRDILLRPVYLRNAERATLKTTLFGKQFDAPFGIAPMGLQGLMWPGAAEILAKAAFDHNIPFVLSTVGTASIESIADITEGNAWFQLYHPVVNAIRDDLIKRAGDSGYPVLVALSDVPVFGYRAKDMRNGLSVPPRMTLRNLVQIASHPNWALNTLFHGQPKFKTMERYMPKGLNLKHLGLFMNKTFDGRLTEDRLKQIRDLWKGKLVLKGVASKEDVETCISLGLDGVIVSNHGGRQLDHGQSSIAALQPIVKQFKGQITIMMDSGIRTGPDIASSIAAGAEFTFLGRSFMYGVAALGKKGGNHTINVVKKQLQQVLDQLCCQTLEELRERRVL